MALTDKLTNIADEIRNKTSLTDEITIDQMVIDIAASPSPIGDVPDYVYTEADRVANIVKNRKPTNGVQFVCVSDLHTGYSTQSDISGLHAVQGACLVKNKANLKHSFFLGDIATGAKTDTLETHKANVLEGRRRISIFTPNLITAGNHECQPYNYDGFLTGEEIYSYIGRFSSGEKPTTGTDRGYCYLDDANSKTRFICLNTCDTKGINIKSQQEDFTAAGMSVVQLQWFVNILLNTPSNYHIIVIGHHPLDWYPFGDYADADGTVWYLRVSNALKILQAYKDGTSGSFTQSGTTVSYDFTSVSPAKVICNLHGHTHNFLYGYIEGTDVYRFAIPNAMHGRENEYNSFKDDVTYSKTTNNAKDTSFCVVTVDYDTETIYLDCYGAGVSREVALSSVNYAITQNLTNVNSSNNIVSVGKDESFTTTLSVASGYKLKTVTVTMGGTDITSTAYNSTTGVITISSVTGDIVITAVRNGYKNILPTLTATAGGTEIYNGIGYKTGYRLNSSGVEKEQSGMCCCGFMPVNQGDIIHFKKVTIAGTNTAYFVEYDASGAFKSVYNITTNTPDIGSDGAYQMRIDSSTTKYIRFAMGVIDSTSIFTINEEIT